MNTKLFIERETAEVKRKRIALREQFLEANKHLTDTHVLETFKEIQTTTRDESGITYLTQEPVVLIPSKREDEQRDFEYWKTQDDCVCSVLEFELRVPNP